MPMKFDQGSPLWGSPPRQKRRLDLALIVLAVMCAAWFGV
jgi:hypothetical protein